MKEFEKYYTYTYKYGKIIGVNKKAHELKDEAFELFKSMYNDHYGSIYEDDNLISIHTGGWSDNEILIEELKKTAWWFVNHKITQSGGHYYFDTDFRSHKKWKVKSYYE